MLKQIAVVSTIVLLSLVGCKKDGPGPITKGDISVSVAWPSGSGTAGKVTATLSPSGATKSSTNLTAGIKFTDLDPATYSVSVEASDAGGTVTHRGTSSNFSVEAGKEAAATVAMQPVFTKGSMSVTANWPNGSTGASTMTVTLEPGNVTRTVSSLSSSVMFSDLTAGTYNVSIRAFDVSSSVSHTGSIAGVVVEAGRQTTIGVPMQVMPPPPPSSVSASKISESSVVVSWSAVPRATSFEVHRSTSPSGPFSQIGTTTSSSFTDSYPTQAQWFYYKIKSVNAGGKSDFSAVASGYRKGWRFANVSVYNPSNGIGFYYDLYAYGFKGVTKSVVLYALYKRNGNYYYVPGSGYLGLAAYKFTLTPAYDETFWSHNWAYIYDNTWDPGYRNNNYPQYIQMRVYKNNPPGSLNDPYYDQTAMFAISWGGSSDAPVPNIIRQLSPEETAQISSQLIQDPSVLSKGDGANSGNMHVNSSRPAIGR